MARAIGQRTLIFDQGDSLLRKRVRWPSTSSGSIQIGGVNLSAGDTWDFTIPEIIAAGLTSSDFAASETANKLYYVGQNMHGRSELQNSDVNIAFTGKPKLYLYNIIRQSRMVKEETLKAIYRLIGFLIHGNTKSSFYNELTRNAPNVAKR